MSDRLQEIRARLDARITTMPGSNERMVWDSGRSYRVEDDRDRARQAFHLHAPSDIAWLLAEIDGLTSSVMALRRQCKAQAQLYAALLKERDELRVEVDELTRRVRMYEVVKS